jgi:putative nucleotidyltransferase with HDIG domain
VIQTDFKSELATAKVKLHTQLDELVQLRPLPATAMQIMKACREQKTNVHDVVQLVECDAAISTRILSVVNSSVYGYSRDVTSINQAVVVLGFNNLSQLAVTIASEQVFSEGDTAVQPRMELYEHSLGCASTARLISKHMETAVDPGSAFLAGMLHDIGKLVLFDIAPNFYSTLQSKHQPDAPLDQENVAFGLNHADIGAKFGAIWELPHEINSAIANHHNLEQKCEPLLEVTAISNELAKHWGIGQVQLETECMRTRTWIADLSEEQCEEFQVQATEQFGELKSLLMS